MDLAIRMVSGESLSRSAPEFLRLPTHSMPRRSLAFQIMRCGIRSLSEFFRSRLELSSTLLSSRFLSKRWGLCSILNPASNVYLLTPRGCIYFVDRGYMISSRPIGIIPELIGLVEAAHTTSKQSLAQERESFPQYHSVVTKGAGSMKNKNAGPFSVFRRVRTGILLNTAT